MRPLALAGLALAGAAFALVLMGEAEAANTNVAVKDNEYDPSTVTIIVGDTVTWNWVGASFHDVEFTTPGAPANCDMQKTGSCVRTFPSSGTFPYICGAHPAQMRGTINVNAPPPNQAPTASFTVSTSGRTASVNGAGSADPDGTIASYSWNWGDGSAASTGQAADHTYAQAGTYTITLTVTDDDGATGSTTRSATTANAAPTADFTLTVTGRSVSVTSTSTDSDGTVASHSWNWGDGTSSSGASATHTYAPGTYTIGLTVTDNLGASGSTTRQATISNAVPVASFTKTLSGRTVSVNAAGSNDADGTIASYAWSFGDGGTASGATATHAYTADGTFTITLTVTDNEAATGSTQQSLEIKPTSETPTNQPPIPKFAATVEGLNVTVDARESVDPDGAIAAFAWDFGDGSAAKTGLTATHAYAVGGNFTIRLSVTDDGGLTREETEQVTVAAPMVPTPPSDPAPPTPRTQQEEPAEEIEAPPTEAEAPPAAPPSERAPTQGAQTPLPPTPPTERPEPPPARSEAAPSPEPSPTPPPRPPPIPEIVDEIQISPEGDRATPAASPRVVSGEVSLADAPETDESRKPTPGPGALAAVGALAIAFLVARGRRT